MFTRADYVKYFEQIGHVERKMIYHVHDTIESIKDPEIIARLRNIGDDEVRHYSYVLGILASKFGKAGTFEQRMSPRENSLGPVMVRAANKTGSPEFRAYCVNLSATGICIESAQKFKRGDCLSLAIDLYDRPGETISRQGWVVWAKELMDFWIGGLFFEWHDLEP